MIRIQRCKKPDELTDEKIEELTNEYKEKGTAVWRKNYIRQALYKMSNGKCCFCEVALGEEGKFMQVEHFHHKDKYQNEVVVWENLLPSCNRCNANKGTHDTYSEPILNPTVDDPKEHLYFQNYRYKGKDLIGKRTISVLYLNDTDGLVNPRYRIGNAVQEKIEEIYDRVAQFDEGTNISTNNRNKIINGVKDILREAQPSEEYSALVATIILNDENYFNLKSIMSKNGLWDSEIERLEDSARSICYNDDRVVNAT